VGNFASEKELYLMLGRFSRQLRDLPDGLFSGDRRDPLPKLDPALANRAGVADQRPAAAAGGRPAEIDPQNREEMLALVKVVVERELAGKSGGSGQRALEELLGLVRSGNHTALAESYAPLLDQVDKPSNDLTKARAMLDRVFG